VTLAKAIDEDVRVGRAEDPPVVVEEVEHLTEIVELAFEATV